jgi:uncharacterized protein YndB with AHSA1/START domain/DNA-binding transcriptional ArsR family regulator
MDAQHVLATIAEPTRYRIVMLLAAAPRTVGEIASTLDALQPQTTKHLQALEAAAVVTVHRLGRRRVAALNREVLRTLSEHLGALAAAHPSESVLAQYEHAIALESRTSTAADRVVRLDRQLNVPPAQAWMAWTDPEQLRQWWAPPHFDVVASEFAPVVGSPIRMVIREGDGAEYAAIGRMIEVTPLRAVTFDLSPLDQDGEPLFAARYEVSFAGTDQTHLTMAISVTAIAPHAQPAIAGLEIGWGQLLDQLAEVLRH